MAERRRVWLAGTATLLLWSCGASVPERAPAGDGAAMAGGSSGATATGSGGALEMGGSTTGSTGGSTAGAVGCPIAGTGSGGAAGAGAGGAAGTSVTGGAGGAGGAGELPAASGVLCIFDYDLTLSSNACAETTGNPEYHCRTNACLTYSWYEQCLAVGARDAIATCVERGAFIGIASHAGADACWDDKIAPIVSEAQFPELTQSARYDNPSAPDFKYPAVDQRSNWNCPTCAYQMVPGANKATLVASIMTHYGLDPNEPSDRSRVMLWDDTVSNLDDLGAVMPEAVRIAVPRHSQNADDGGCGITSTEIDAGWDSLQ